MLLYKCFFAGRQNEKALRNLILFAVADSGAVPVPSTFAQASGSVKGVCKDPEGKPIAGGVVSLEQSRQRPEIHPQDQQKGEYFSLGLCAG